MEGYVRTVLTMRFGRPACPVRFVGLVVVLTTAVAAASPRTASATSQSLVVPTDKGVVQGFRAGEVDEFLGIPYAAPPVGARRWAPPVPAASWQGVRAATAYGNRCAQLASGNGPRSESEDCLYLNVYRPAGLPVDQRLPVLFWIHGGGLRSGASNQHDGSLLASTNGIVVVSINYRLGVFGFLALPSLSAESPSRSSGDYGLLDQQAALGWVNRNIAAFGGDPGRVTIAGESAGAWSTCANLVSPATRGLFWSAIMQSGNCASRPLAASESAGAKFAEQVGCADPATGAACLRSKPASALLDAGESFQPRITPGGGELPVAPADAVAAGAYPRVPLLFGDNLDEGRYFAQLGHSGGGPASTFCAAASAQARLAAIELGTSFLSDDEPFVVYRGDAARLLQLDPSIHHQTVQPRKLIKNDGTISVQTVESVRPAQPSLREDNETFGGGVLFLTVRSFLSGRAVRATNSMDGIDQNLSGRRIAVVVLPSNQVPVVVGLLPDLERFLDTIQPGTLVEL